MNTSNLYSSVLLEPCFNHGCNELYIVSGYSSATFANHHIRDLIKLKSGVKVNLLIGMPGAKNDHLAFVELHKEFPLNFFGYYYYGQPPVHCKIYSWCKNDNPILAYSGSANYSQYGFSDEQQLNQLTEDNPTSIKNLYDKLLIYSTFMPNHQLAMPIGAVPVITIKGSVAPGKILWEIPDKRVRISFLGEDGELPKTSGLNWGQRTENVYEAGTRNIIKVRQRNRDEAYLSLKSDSRKEGFLPNLAFTFSLITDDAQTFDCVVAQQGRKAIHTTNNNSLLGLYFRKRLGLPSGAFVNREHLENYGRTDFTIEKINEETFLLDFSI